MIGESVAGEDKFMKLKAFLQLDSAVEMMMIIVCLN